MKLPLLVLTLGLVVTGSPIIERVDSDVPHVLRRQNIDFQLVDDTPEPTIVPDNSTDYNQQAAILEVLASINDDPLPQDSPLGKRDISSQLILDTHRTYSSLEQPSMLL